MSWENIVPFFRPIEYLILDPDVSDILVNASGRVFVERFGQMQEVPGVVLSEKLALAVRHIARALDSDINEEKPLLDAGSRTAPASRPYILPAPSTARLSPSGNSRANAIGLDDSSGSDLTPNAAGTAHSGRNCTRTS